MSEQSQLEKDFNEIKDAINAKLKEAAEAVLAAQAIADSKGLTLMKCDDDGYVSRYLDYEANIAFETRQLENAMETAGWRPSSWNC